MKPLSTILRNARYATEVGAGIATVGLFLIWITVDFHQKTKPMSGTGWFLQHVGYSLLSPRIPLVQSPFVAAIIFYSAAAFFVLTLVSIYLGNQTVKDDS